MRRRHLLLALLVMPLAAARADATAVAGESARLVVENTTTRMLGVLRADRERLRQEPKHIYGLVNEIILPHFDFDRMSRWVLGRYWREASEDQRRRFIQEFRALLVRTYSTALLEYSDQTINVLPVQAASDATEVVVRTEVRQPGSPPIPIQYSMNLEKGNWRVHDVTIDGVSLVASYRSTFNAEGARGGVERILAVLAERNSGQGQP